MEASGGEHGGEHGGGYLAEGARLFRGNVKRDVETARGVPGRRDGRDSRATWQMVSERRIAVALR